MSKPRTEETTQSKVKPMDSTLRLASKLDRLIGQMDPKMRRWAIEFLKDKYLASETPTVQAPGSN